MDTKYIIYTDGGARGNPGPAGIGVVIYDAENNIVKKIGEHIGSTTNNQAEYKALLRGLDEVLALGGDSVVCYLDSELVQRQLIGKYKIREEGLKLLAAEVFKSTGKFKQVEFSHVLREKNKLADELVNISLDEAGF